ncbi:MAG: response regulator [Nocardioides sp.]
MPEGTFRVLVVDDHQLIAESMAAALRSNGLEVRLADLACRTALLEHVRADPPDLVLLDLELGGAIGDGSTLVRPFVQAGARVLLVSATTDQDRIGSALEQGALGHVAKSMPFLSLLHTTLEAAMGGEVMPPEERRKVLHDLRVSRERKAAAHEPFERLTPREQQVLRALADGRNVAGIAAEWFVSESTVRSQVRGILTKLGAGSQLEAVAQALKVGWLKPTDAPDAITDPGPSRGDDPPEDQSHIPRQR